MPRKFRDEEEEEDEDDEDDDECGSDEGENFREFECLILCEK